MRSFKQFSKSRVLNLLVPAYPQIKIVPLCVPPNQKFYPKGLLFSIFFNFAYPLCPSHVPLDGDAYPRLRTAVLNNFISIHDFVAFFDELLPARTILYQTFTHLGITRLHIIIIFFSVQLQKGAGVTFDLTFFDNSKVIDFDN